MIRRLIGAAVVVAGLTGCLRERDRLDVPRVRLVLQSLDVAPGDSVRGYVYAVDATGIVFLQVTAMTGDSTASRRLNRISRDSVQIDFALRVPANAAADAPVTIRAIARDTQDFEVDTVETVYVRAGAAPP